MEKSNFDITLLNLNMLFIRYGEETERECHLPLGCLYLVQALTGAGFRVDFRDYQLCESPDPFSFETFLQFANNPAPVIGLSCMANLLPFTILAAKVLKERYPECVIILGGVGSKGVEDKLLRRFPWIDVISRGEGEITGVELLRCLLENNDLSKIDGISYRCNGLCFHNPERARISDLDSIPFPALSEVDLSKYAGFGMMTSRGCPYPCTFCSVAPVWNLESYSRSPENIIGEMRYLNEKAGVDLFLFQDEFFISGKRQVLDFCNSLQSSGLQIEWKAFGRVNLVDQEMLQAMADCGCLELRFGIESGSDKILTMTKKGFTTKQVLDLIPSALRLFPRVDLFYIWGFPFETMDDFNQTLFQMISFRMLGARILPSLLSLLPQTALFQEWSQKVELEFCPFLLPEFVFTGHEVCIGSKVMIPEQYQSYFDFIIANPDIFPGFFHIDIQNNVLPKLRLLEQFGFYSSVPANNLQEIHESCGAHSPRVSS